MLPSESVSVAVAPAVMVAGRIVFVSVDALGVTVSGALAAGVVPAAVTTVLVVLVTAPGVVDVIVTTIVQPPAGTDAPAGSVRRIGVTAAPTHVPVFPDVVVTPAGMGSVKAAVNVCATALVFDSVSVSVAVPPATMEAGAIVLVSVNNAAVTVSGALAAGAVPAPVTNVLVVLVTVPGVDDVIVTTIVQPPGGTAVPAGSVISVGVTATAGQLPVLPDVVVTPAGIGSMNATVNVCATAFTLDSVSVSVAVPPATMEAGAIVLVSVNNAAVTVSGALAVGAVPAPVTNVLVVLVTVPGVDDVIVTTIVQPPGGTDAPAGKVISVGVTATAGQLPVLPDVVVTPAGMGSVNAAVNACATAFTLDSVSVSVAVPPATMEAGEIALASVNGAAVTVSGALAGGAVPPAVTSVLVVLVTTPGVVDVIVTTIVQPPGGTDAPAGIVIRTGVTATPAQVPVLPDVVVTPAGMGSVNGAVNSCATALMLDSVSVSVAEPPAAMLAGAMVLASVNGAAVTVSGALAGGAIPPAVTSVLVVLVTTPGVLDVIVTTIVQPPAGTDAPEGSVIKLGATATPAHVPVFPDVVVTPAGIGSVNGAVSNCATELMLDSVSVSVAEPPATMDAGAIALESESGATLTVSGALAAGAVPAPVTRVLVVFVTVPGVLDVIVTTMVQPPGGTDAPEGSVIRLGATATPAHVPVLPEVVDTPAGIGSVKGAVNNCTTALPLDSVSVSVAEPPAVMTAGEIALASESVAADTVSGALAGGATPPAVWMAEVVLVTGPGVLDVMVTTIVQPPTGTGEPGAIVISAGVTVTPAQLPRFPLMVVTPGGIGSLKIAVSVVGAAFGLPMVSVNVADPPATMAAGEIDLANVTGASLTVSGALAAGAAPAPVLRALVVLTTVPGRLDVMETTIVQPPGGISDPEGSVMSTGVTATPAHEPVFPDVVVMPAGMESVKFAVSACGVALGLPSVSVSVDVPPAVIVAGTMVLASVAVTALTVSGAEAIGAVPVSVCSWLVMLVTRPGVVDVIVTTIVQPPTGMLAPPAIVMSVGATATPAHVPVLPDVVVTPGGIGSVKADVSAVAIALGLPSVSVNVALPPAAIVAGCNALPQRRRKHGDGQRCAGGRRVAECRLQRTGGVEDRCPGSTT